LENINSDQILDDILDGMVILDADGKVIYYNKSASRLEQLARTKITKGAAWTDIVSNQRKDIVAAVIKQVLQLRRRQTMEAEYTDASGRPAFLEVTYHPILRGADAPIQICVIAHEITHQKIFERRSVQLIKELSDLIENANALIFSVDTRKYITEWNKECTRITGNSKNDVLAQKVYFHLDERSHPDFDVLMDKILTGETVSNQELLVRTRNENTVTVLVNATPKFNSARNVIGVLLVGQDVTELTEYRTGLEEKVKDRTEKLKEALSKEKELVDLRNRFVSVASHEFRIPLSTISAHVKNVKTNEQLRKSDTQALEAIENQVLHMKKLLEDVLTVKKGEINALIANYQRVEIIRFLKELVNEALTNAQHSHEVRTEFNVPYLEIESDEKLLRNIFLNLLSNAIKFSPGQKEIVLSVNADSHQVAIKVTDKGIGIAEQDLKMIFEPFHRGSNAGSIKGTGLGFSIVKKAVDVLGGTLHINSVINEGTTITVIFKLKKE
jgi:PAS domain S-box-containing protein